MFIRLKSFIASKLPQHILVRNFPFLKELPFDYQKYWKKRYDRFGFNIFYCCGNEYQSEKENHEWYRLAGEHLINAVKKTGLDKNCSILDVGCGIGYYANLLKAQGYKNYKGIDLNERIIDELNKKEKQGYKFEQKDILKEQIRGEYDLIMMIWVTGHIIKDSDFYSVMGNIKTSLKKGGYFLVTDKIKEDKRDNLYARRRTLDYYTQIFGEPVEIIDDFLFNSVQLMVFKKLEQYGV